MEWVPAVLSSGGPWAILGGVVFTVVGLIVRGALVPGAHVDRIVTAYKEIIEHERADKLAWKTAHELEAEGGRVLREQNSKLLEHSSVSTHALESLHRIAEQRSDAP